MKSMQAATAPRTTKWPFFAGDLLLLGMAAFVYAQGQRPLGLREMALAAGCILAGAFLAIIPFIMDQRAEMRLAESSGLTTVVSQIKTLESVAAQIGAATAAWQTVQESADKTSGAAHAIADRMTAEVNAFTEFMKGANETEKATLRLEVEKLRRAEGDWLQVLVRIMDHVYALHQAALRSGQANVINQMSHFQSACRDATRRVGLTPFTAAPGEKFSSQRHQIVEGGQAPGPEASIAETVATGYSFQGRMLRAALVRVAPPEPANASSASQEPENRQSSLPLTSESA